jgi:hypothetical protein
MVDNLYDETERHKKMKENKDEINWTMQQDMLYWTTKEMEDILEELDIDPIKKKFLNINKATWIIFICGLFNDSVSSSKYVTSNGRILSEY